ncbi:MAG: hypothetical protein JKY37_16530 [Nannocystaceae bacterium]|nr:hypothetical protein [Nannocystaceae bacterium]
MQLRLILMLAAVGLACGGDDEPADTTTTFGGGGPMTMTLTTMTSLTMGEPTNEDTGGSTGGTTEALDDTGDSSTGESLPVCPGACVELAPQGWSGPVATIDSSPTDEAPPCPDSFSTVAVEAFDDFEATPAVCDYDCGEAASVVCDQIGRMVNHGSVEPNCAGAQVDAVNLANGACINVPVGGSSSVRLEPVELLALGECEPIAAIELPEPTFGTRVTACEPEVMRGFSCDEGDAMGCIAEVPATPLGAQMCIWQEGEHDCPQDSGYIDDRVLYNDFESDRDCTECACDDPVGVCDNASVALYTSVNCTSGLTALMTGEGFCTEVGVTTATARFIAGTPTAFCPAAQVQAVGEANPTQPFTLCCTQ